MSQEQVNDFETVPVGTRDRLSILTCRLQIAEHALRVIRDFYDEDDRGPGEIAAEALKAIVAATPTPSAKGGET